MSEGWICPKCGSVYGPHTYECIRCNKNTITQQDSVIGSTTSSELVSGGSIPSPAYNFIGDHMTTRNCPKCEEEVEGEIVKNTWGEFECECGHCWGEDCYEDWVAHAEYLRDKEREGG